MKGMHRQYQGHSTVGKASSERKIRVDQQERRTCYHQSFRQQATHCVVTIAYGQEKIDQRRQKWILQVDFQTPWTMDREVTSQSAPHL